MESKMLIFPNQKKKKKGSRERDQMTADIIRSGYCLDGTEYLFGQQ